MMRQGMDTNCVAILSSNMILDVAYQIICNFRKNSGSNNSIWDLKFHWSNVKSLDWLIVANKRHHLKRAIKTAYKVVAKLKLEIARNKTEMGQTKRTCTFLGYQLDAKKLHVSVDSQKRASEKIVRLYEQNAPNKHIEQYITRWHIWARTGIPASVIKLELPSWIIELLVVLKSLDQSSMSGSLKGEKYETIIIGYNTMCDMCDKSGSVGRVCGE